jgi:Flp pilus assembly pilin Flp
MHLFAQRAARGPRRRGARGASSIEYVLLMIVITAVLVAVALGVASIVRDAFQHATNCVTNGNPSTSCPSSFR